MITVLKNAHVYGPQDMGQKNVVIVNDKIVIVADDTDQFERLDQVKIYDYAGKYLVPGLIDLHVHITGGGGEQGPASRVPEAKVSEIFACGCTTVLGLLGVDGVSRSNENLITKARALTEEGVTCYALVSNYAVPATTVTGSIEKDIMMIDPVVGVKCALAEPRASYPTETEMNRMATEVRRGGMLSGKSGLVVFHLGDGPDRMTELLNLVKRSIVPPKHLLPTHVNYYCDPELTAQSEEFVRMGGTVDYTAGFNLRDVENTVQAVADHYQKFGNLDHVTLSSDSYGSCPELDESGNVIRMCYATGKYLLTVIQMVASQCGVPLEECLKMLTSNPARVLCLDNKKGYITPGADADLLILDEQLKVHTLFSRGSLAVENGVVVRNGFYGGA